MLNLVGAIAGAVVPVELAQSQHGATMASSSAMHRQSVGRSVLQAQETAELERSLHERSIRRAQRIHYETVSYELDIARREVDRDILQQKNNVIQTLMVVNTVMIISIYSLLVQGYMQPSPGVLVEAHTLLYTILCGLSVISHVASVYVAFKLNSRSIQFQMHNPQVHYKPCGNTHIDFTSFYECHCASMESFSLVLFYAGATLALATCACFVWIVDIGSSSSGGGTSGSGSKNDRASIACVIVAAAGIASSVFLYYAS